MNIEPIGTFYCQQKYKFEQPRQGVLANDQNYGKVVLATGHNFEQALDGLTGFDRLWLIYGFHLNNNWKPMVSPPRHSDKKVGLFASRSPHRPNQLGLSCVKLVSVDQRSKTIVVSQFDLINETPIYDIKPYLPYCDSFPDSKTGWVDSSSNVDVKPAEPSFVLTWSPESIQQLEWLNQNKVGDIKNFVELQLKYQPTNSKKKRVKFLKELLIHQLAWRTWRIHFKIDEIKSLVSIKSITSGYSKSDLSPTQIRSDKYNDKKIHLSFINTFYPPFIQ